ncbi:hypothetical protein ACLOJK_033053 [Asimina triloba]
MEKWRESTTNLLRAGGGLRLRELALPEGDEDEVYDLEGELERERDLDLERDGDRESEPEKDREVDDEPEGEAGRPRPGLAMLDGGAEENLKWRKETLEKPWRTSCPSRAPIPRCLSRNLILYCGRAPSVMQIFTGHPRKTAQVTLTL